MFYLQEEFYELTPTLQNYWRAIILFGKNTACYKFALAKALFKYANSNNDIININELAKVYSYEICKHLSYYDRQTTSNSSKFLDICRLYNQNAISQTQLIDKTVQYGFKDVLDAFHIVAKEPIKKLFFLDERKTNKGIRITENLYKLHEMSNYFDLEREIEARWQLVEFAWHNKISNSIITYDNLDGSLFGTDIKKRVNLASCRDALNGYQKGVCFYCYGNINLIQASQEYADVDHFLPYTLQQKSQINNLNGIWNLVLACRDCNRGVNGKFDKIPDICYLKRLYKRNEYLITSHHPLKETLIKQTGTTPDKRKFFLQNNYNEAKLRLIQNWTTNTKGTAIF
ncbi:HNH endonuclease domain-containing protein [Thorsellia anophelis]|uniref:HNH endonuclease n=1 Tax=Thorsellia anophelis DSM 18579 TaxID=1123402 RepID=A0A1I0DI28_9GAMM|nr:HNH endonuclease domain-containing protein [Thorsellia anophelis]SET31883.1 HNH endonuclease [Thorsellia anophelis DSM 18579]